jgi:hypothetical protein
VCWWIAWFDPFSGPAATQVATPDEAMILPEDQTRVIAVPHALRVRIKAGPDFMMECKHLFVLLFVFAAGCEEIGGSKITADLSTPKSAAVAYLQAIQKGDGRTARALCIGTSEQMGWVDGRVTLVDGMRSFDKALYARFGNITLQVHTDMYESLTKLADIWVPAISDGAVSADDQKARIDPAHEGFFTRFVNPVYLKHVKEGWKVDLAQTYAASTPADEYPSISADYQQWRQFGEMFQAAARDVKAGRYGTVDEANQALLDRLAALRKGS